MQTLLRFPYYKACRRLGVGVLLLAVFCTKVASFPIAHADTATPNFAVQPAFYDPADARTRSYFIFNGQPGLRMRNSIRITNVGTAKGTAMLSSVDAITGQTTGVSYLDPKDPRHDVGTWVAFNTQQVTLDAGKSQDIPFQLFIPSHVRSGQHVGGIIVSSTIQEHPPAGKNKVTIAVQRQTVVSIVVNLPGSKLEQLDATHVQFDAASTYQRVLVSLRNSGNMMVIPVGSAQISDAGGKVVQTSKMIMDILVPQTSIQFPINMLPKALPVGTYTLKLALTYGKQTRHTLLYTGTFTIASAGNSAANMGAGNPVSGTSFWQQLSPWYYVLGVFILLLVLSSLVFWTRSTYRLIAVRRVKGRNITRDGHP